MRLIGLEPTRLSTLDPKSSAATNYATGAALFFLSECKGREYFEITKRFRKKGDKKAKKYVYHSFLLKKLIAVSIMVSIPLL